jgi:hypothetical protein
MECRCFSGANTFASVPYRTFSFRLLVSVAVLEKVLHFRFYYGFIVVIYKHMFVLLTFMQRTNTCAVQSVSIACNHLSVIRGGYGKTEELVDPCALLLRFSNPTTQF